jgi:flagellar motor switch protein FliM
MKPERAFIAERAAAVHCPELLRAGPSPTELMPRLSQVGDRFAKAFAPLLAPFAGGETPKIRAHPARQDDDLMFGAEVGGLAANSLFAIGPHAVPVLVSLQAGAVLGFVDRTFGGRGLAPDPLPDRLPLSAELMIARIEDAVMTCLASALGHADASAIYLMRRDGNLSQLGAYAEGVPLAVVKFEVTEEGRPAWNGFICLAESLLPMLFGEAGSAPASTKRTPAAPDSEPFGDLPLEMAAVLVDMRISMAAIAAIEPGTILPVAVARAVPLKIGGKTVASGSVGAADDRVAIRITQAFA